MEATNNSPGGLEAPESDAGTFDDPSHPRGPLASPGSASGAVGVATATPPAAIFDPCLLSIHEHKSGRPCQEKTYDDIRKESQRTGIEGLPGRLERYAAAHSRALEMADHLRRQDDRGLADRAENLTLCGSYLEFRWYFTLADHPVRLHAAKFCQQDRLCPFCAIRRAAKLLRRYSARVLHQLALCPGLVPTMITATVRNGDDLGERVRHLGESWSKLMQRGKSHNRGRGPWSESSRAWGSVGSIEVKRGEGTRGGSWHPHIHAVWLCESEVDQSALSAEWLHITGDSHVVDARPFHFHRDGLPPTADNVAADFAEVFKYALKFSTMDLGDNLHAFKSLFGRRLVRPHGTLYGIEAPDDLTDDPLEPEDLPFITHLFRYSGGHYS